MNHFRVRAIRRFGQIQGWSVERRYPWGWRECDFYDANFYRASAHQRAMTSAHKLAREISDELRLKRETSHATRQCSYPGSGGGLSCDWAGAR